MKRRSTTPAFKGLATKSVVVAVAVMVAVSVPASILSSSPVRARDFESELRAVQRQIDGYTEEARKLDQKAQTLENELARLSVEKAAIQAKIDLSQKKYDKLQKEIKENKEKIAENRDALGVTIADMYVTDSITPLEMLASSNNIGDYVDKQTYRSSISDELQQTINRINKLQAELEQQKKDVKRVLADQTNQRNALAKKEAERAQLVRETRGKEATYQQLTEEAKAKKKEIVEAQQAAIAAAYNRGGGMISAGNLPAYQAWAGDCYVDNAGYSHGGSGGNGQDPVGYGCNQCVSYTAWKMGQITGYIPSYWGNANMWPGSARAAGFKVTNQPRAKALGVISAGTYGHIVYIEAYHPETNTVDISQYNEWLPGKGYGHFSTRTGVSAYTYDTYIYL